MHALVVEREAADAPALREQGKAGKRGLAPAGKRAKDGGVLLLHLPARLEPDRGAAADRVEDRHPVGAVERNIRVLVRGRPAHPYAPDQAHRRAIIREDPQSSRSGGRRRQSHVDDGFDDLRQRDRLRERAGERVQARELRRRPFGELAGGPLGAGEAGSIEELRAPQRQRLEEGAIVVAEGPGHRESHADHAHRSPVQPERDAGDRPPRDIRVRARELGVARREVLRGAEQHGGSPVERVGDGQRDGQRHEPEAIVVLVPVSDRALELEVGARLVDEEDAAGDRAERGHRLSEQSPRDLLDRLRVDPGRDPLQPRERLVKDANAWLGLGPAGETHEEDIRVERARVPEESSAVARAKRERRRRFADGDRQEKRAEAKGLGRIARQPCAIQGRDARPEGFGAGDVGRQNPACARRQQERFAQMEKEVLERLAAVLVERHGFLATGSRPPFALPTAAAAGDRGSSRTRCSIRSRGARRKRSLAGRCCPPSGPGCRCSPGPVRVRGFPRD